MMIGDTFRAGRGAGHRALDNCLKRRQPSSRKSGSQQTRRIAAAVSIIVAANNRSTLQEMHRERLNLDRDLADRRTNADIALAERKVALDRALEAWKRRTEFAEVVIADFYQAQRIIDEARSPGSMGNEGSTRPKVAGETEDEERTLNAYFVTAERLNNRSEFFAQHSNPRFPAREGGLRALSSHTLRVVFHATTRCRSQRGSRVSSPGSMPLSDRGNRPETSGALHLGYGPLANLSRVAR